MVVKDAKTGRKVKPEVLPRCGERFYVTGFRRMRPKSRRSKADSRRGARTIANAQRTLSAPCGSDAYPESPPVAKTVRSQSTGGKHLVSPRHPREVLPLHHPLVARRRWGPRRGNCHVRCGKRHAIPRQIAAAATRAIAPSDATSAELVIWLERRGAASFFFLGGGRSQAPVSIRQPSRYHRRLQDCEGGAGRGAMGAVVVPCQKGDRSGPGCGSQTIQAQHADNPTFIQTASRARLTPRQTQASKRECRFTTSRVRRTAQDQHGVRSAVSRWTTWSQGRKSSIRKSAVAKSCKRLAACKYAIIHGMVHRDVKPANSEYDD